MWVTSGRSETILKRVLTGPNGKILCEPHHVLVPQFYWILLQLRTQIQEATTLQYLRLLSPPHTSASLDITAMPLSDEMFLRAITTDLASLILLGSFSSQIYWGIKS